MARVGAPPKVLPAASPGSGSGAPVAPGRPDGPDRSPLRRLSRRTSRRLSRRTWLLVGAGLVLIVLVVGFVVTRPDGPAPLTRRDVDASVQTGLAKQAEEAARAPADGTIAYAAIQPSLVLIRTSATTGERGTGAGVVVNADGTILTARHVVHGAASITVSFADGTSSPAKVAAEQRENDIATLTPAKLPETVVPAVLGGGVPVGAEVFAVGHPFGLTGSLSSGVVSALDRTVRVRGDQTLEHLIQIDAAVNPGNSGGPLLNKAGQVVGIVTALANPTDQSVFVGIGFAVPIATAGGAAGGPPR